MNYSTVLSGVATAAILMICATECYGLTRNNRPNVVIFFGDDLGYGDLDVYGHPTSSTPNLARLAAGGKVLTEFYSAAAVCSPSRAALLTGRFQMRSGIYPGVFNVLKSGGLPHNETTVAEMLKPLGYYTAMVGKWHLGLGEDGKYLPPHHGFDEFLGLPASPAQCPCSVCFYPNVSCHQAPCKTQYTACALFNGTRIIQQPVDLLTLDERYTAQARQMIQTKAQRGTPFLLYYASQHTHHPQYAGKETSGTCPRGRFGDSLAALDWEVGQIYDQLQESGVLEETFFIFTADNGPSLTWKNFGGNAGLLKCGKGTTYEGGMRVPAIVHWPGQIGPGRSLALSSTLDVLPTIAAVTGAPLPNVTLDGYDMSPFLFNGQPSLREVFYYYPESCSKALKSYAIRHNQYKVVFITQGNPQSSNENKDLDCRGSLPEMHDPPLLFDLFEDPSENYNLSRADDPALQAVVAMATQLREEFDSKMVWGQSEIHKPSHADLMPCCNPGCSPFPSCCHCIPGQDSETTDEQHASPRVDRPQSKTGKSGVNKAN